MAINQTHNFCQECHWTRLTNSTCFGRFQVSRDEIPPQISFVNIDTCFKIVYVHSTLEWCYFGCRKCVFIIFDCFILNRCSNLFHIHRLFSFDLFHFNSNWFSFQTTLALWWCGEHWYILYMKLYRHLINFQLYLIGMKRNGLAEHYSNLTLHFQLG